jgi:hypothetical protein
MLTNKIDIVITRDDVERWVGMSLDDEQWYSLSSEIQGTLEEEIIPTHVSRYTESTINDLVEEDAKWLI